MKISLITVIFNNAETLKATIDSVVKQSYSNIEYIIVDGVSTDGSLDIINQHKDKITTFISEPDKGLYDALNKGIRLATGDVVGFIHADDLYASDRIIAQVAKAFEVTGADAVYGDLYYVQKDNPDKIIRYWKSNPFQYSLLKKGWMPPHPTFFVKRELYHRYGMFDTRYRIAADYDLMLRFLGKYRITATYVPEVFIRMRMGGVSNRSLKNIVCKMKEDYSAITRNDVGNLFTLLLKNISKFNQFFRRK